MRRKVVSPLRCLTVNDMMWKCMDWNALEGVFCFMGGYQVIFKAEDCCSRSPVT